MTTNLRSFDCAALLPLPARNERQGEGWGEGINCRSAPNEQSAGMRTPRPHYVRFPVRRTVGGTPGRGVVHGSSTRAMPTGPSPEGPGYQACGQASCGRNANDRRGNLPQPPRSEIVRRGQGEFIPCVVARIAIATEDEQNWCAQVERMSWSDPRQG